MRASKLEANARYDSKTYKKILLKLRVVEDADLIEDLERAKREQGLKNREWVRDLFEGIKHD